MTFRRQSMLALSFSLCLGCSSGSGKPGGPSGGAGNGAAGQTAGQSGGMAGAGGSPSGAAGEMSGTAGGMAGSTGGSMGGSSGGSTGAAGSTGAGGMAGAGAAGAAGGGAGQSGGGGAQGGSGGTGASAGPFSCTIVLGLFTTSQWFIGAQPGGASKTFLQQDGIDPMKWEGKMTKYSYVEKWADPMSAQWSLMTQNPCATNSTTPDRALFVGFSPGIPADQDYAKYNAMAKDQAGWETQLNLVINNIKTKYPSVKEIDILTMGRAPNNMLCSNNSDIDTVIAPYEDAAFEAVAAASNGLVKVGPKYYVPDCATSYIFANDSDYTTTASNSLAMQIAAYYAQHP
jgi:hypothetical protein